MEAKKCLSLDGNHSLRKISRAVSGTGKAPKNPQGLKLSTESCECPDPKTADLGKKPLSIMENLLL